MRLRNIKNKGEILDSSSYLIKDPIKYKGKWATLFNNNNPIFLEIGMGKGKFIIDNAIRYPDINFIGLEKFDSVLARGLPKIPSDLKNLFIVRLDAINICEIFDKEIDKIYLNFSDPWPKVRHHMRRLTSELFLSKYDLIFKKDYEIEMKTDNQDLYVYSLMSLSSHGYVLKDISFDLHARGDVDLITTEYEDKFSSLGMPIYFVSAIKKCK